MIKNCAHCGIPFSTKDSRQQSCSKPCADIRRSVTQTSLKGVINIGENISPVQLESFKKEWAGVVDKSMNLPDPETLPAAYVKRVHDLWVSLTEDGPKRIA